jgi:hypothetical protein
VTRVHQAQAKFPVQPALLDITPCQYVLEAIAFDRHGAKLQLELGGGKPSLGNACFANQAAMTIDPETD